jgi:hypothetical protein
MKKLITIVFAVTIMFGCSSSDDGEQSNNLLSFKLVGYHNYSDDFDVTSYWEVEELTNGNFRYTINALVDRDGVDNPDEPHTASPFRLEFEVNQQIEVGQIINIDEIDFIEGNFPTNNNSINPVGPCYTSDIVNQSSVSMQPEITPSTTGQIKITGINGDSISGTFFFNNLRNFYYNEVQPGQNYYQFFGCSTSTVPAAPITMTISNGRFNNLLKQ